MITPLDSRPNLRRVLVVLLITSLAPLSIGAPVAAVAGPDMTITKSASAGSIQLDEFVIYTLTARNEGSSTATDVAIFDGTIDFEDLAVTEVTTTQGSCVKKAGTNVVNCKVGSVAAGADVTVTIRATVKAATCDGRVRNHAFVKAANEPVENTANDSSAPVVVSIIGCGGTDPVDLRITKVASDTSITAGDPVTFTLTVRNVGTATAENVVVYDYTIDLNDLELIGVNPTSQCGESSHITNDVVCRYATIPAGGERIITILTSSQPATCDGIARNHAFVRATNEPYANQGDDVSERVVVNIDNCGSFPDDTTRPTGSLKINGGGPTAYGPWALLNLHATDTESAIANVLVSNTSSATGGVLDKAKIVSYPSTPTWSLTAAAYGGTAGGGTKTVFVQYQDAAGNWSSIVNDNINMVRDAPNLCSGARALAPRRTGIWHQEQIFRAGDVDWFKFHKSSSGRAIITLGAQPANYRLTIHNSNCGLIATAADAPGFEQIYRDLPAGTYFARVAGASSTVRSVSRYSLKFRILQPGVLVLSATRWSQNGQLTVAGVVLNNTLSRRNLVKITARYYNASNSLIGSDSAYAMLPIIGSRKQAPFRIVGPSVAGLDHVAFSVASSTTSSFPVSNLHLTLQAAFVQNGVRHQKGTLRNDNVFTVRNAKTAIAIFDKLGDVINVRLVAVSPATLGPADSGTFDLALSRYAGVVRQMIWARAGR
jgi:hypothetical protein